ncbi:MAG TPA: site-specific DNA-methyltransferase, partial [Nitrospiraceae bacterium]|nr:site-specific DNA-methyltransferase [Nitrospiraceae bacterium]
MVKTNTKTNEVNQTGLYWPGKRTEVERVILPFQTVETINESKADRDELILFRQRGEPAPGWRNKLIWGDNKYIMASLLPEFAGKINLIYIDPPFFTGTDQTINLRIGADLTVTKEPSIIEEAAYRNIWRYGAASYFQWIYDRLSLMRELLSRNGMIFIRHDQYWSHYVKVITDEIFGKGNFQNEIVVKRIYKNVTQQGRISIPIATDSLFVYFKSTNAHYFDIYKKLSQTRESYWRALDDSSGIRRPPERKILGKAFYPPPGKHFKFSQNKIDALMEEGRIRINPETGRPQYLVAPADTIVLNSNWTDISGYSFTTGYPTENSEDLLERVIKAGSESGDLVADFFCGSGTTLAVAEKLGRRWIGSDLSKFAIHTTRKRLLDIHDCKPFEVLNLGKYQKVKLKENGVSRYIDFILKLYRAEPVSGYITLHGKKAGRMVHIGDVDSIVTEREIRETVKECASAGVKSVDILGWDFEMGLHDLVDRIGDEHSVKIRLVQIPREALEVKDAAKEEVKFFDLNYLEIEHTVGSRQHRGGGTITINLKDFVISNPEYLPDEVREKVKKFTDYIDYWAVDFDYKDDTFHNMWQSFRTRKHPALETKYTHTYQVDSRQQTVDREEKKQVLVKV